MEAIPSLPFSLPSFPLEFPRTLWSGFLALETPNPIQFLISRPRIPNPEISQQLLLRSFSSVITGVINSNYCCERAGILHHPGTPNLLESAPKWKRGLPKDTIPLPSRCLEPKPFLSEL